MIKLFALLLSFQLIIAPVTVAHAEGDATAGMGDAYVKTGTGSSGGYDFYVNQILVLATSAIGSSIITQCLEGLKVPSIATYMAGSLVHIASEILGAKSKNDKSKKKLKDIELNQEKLVKKGDSGQKAALEQALQEEKDNEEFLRNRKNWMIAITAIYTAAAGLAIAEDIYGWGSGLTAATTACSTTAAGCTLGYAACAAECAAGTATIATTLLSGAATGLPEARTIVNSTCTPFSPNSTGCFALGNLYIALVYGNCQVKAVDGGASMLSWPTLLTLAYGFGMGKVGSSGGQVSQYGSMIISLLMMLIPSLSSIVMQAYNFPIPRSITFGASAVLSGLVMSGLAKREEVAGDNIVKLKNTISQFEVTSATPNSLVLDENTTEQGGDQQNAKIKTGNVKGLAAAPQKSCIGRNGSSWDVSPSSCGKSIKVSKPNFGKINIPTLNNVANLAADMAQSLADGDQAGANKIANEIGTMAARVKQTTDQLKAQYNEIQKKNKKPTRDFDKDIKSKVATLQGELRKAAASKKMDLASLGSSAPDKLPEGKETTPEVEVATVPGMPIPEVDPLAGLGGEATAPVVEEGAVATTPQQSLDDFESTVEDISKRSDVSIFKQVSNRYILNYTKFFEARREVELEKSAPVAPEQAPVQN